MPKPESSADLQAENDSSTLVSDSEEGGSQPKQIKLNEPVDETKSMHTNPMDDTILSKKVGKL